MNTIIMQKTYLLYVKINNLINFWPKRQRYNLGLRIENNCLALLEQIIFAHQVLPVLKDRYLLESSVKNEIMKILVRLVMEQKLIKETIYFSLSRDLLEIGKMLGGWRKSLSK